VVDFTTIKAQVNTGTSPAGEGSGAATWTDLLFGTASYELRLCAAAAGGASIASASWPTFLRPGSTAIIPEMWGYFGSDASGGLKVTNYDGTSAHYLQFRISWDSVGTFASAPIISAWKDSSLPAASPGTQPGSGDGSAFVNGQTTDTSNTSYIKANFYGFGVDASGNQQTPSANAAGTLTVTSGTAGAVSPGTGAFLATWQSLQALTQYIQDGAVPKATTAGVWYGVLVFYCGPNMTAGTNVPVVGVQYTWV